MEKLLAALQYGTEYARENAKSVQELLLPEGREEQNWHRISETPYYTEMMSAIRNAGESMLGERIHSIPFSLYRLFDTTGSRVDYQAAYFEHRKRMNVFAILSLTQGGDRYLQELEDAIWAICDEYTWCLPAHLGGTSLQADKIQSDSRKRDHRHSLDLFACETAFALSEILSLLGKNLHELGVHRAKAEIMERVLTSYVSLLPAFWWETTDMNWAAVCAGSIGSAAMYLIEEDAALCPLLYRVLSTMESFLSGFPEDGACLEGIGYWTYGFGFYTYFATLLRQRTAGKIDLLSDPRAGKIALFQQKCILSGNQVMSYADSTPEHLYCLGLSHKLKSSYRDFELPEKKYSAPIFDECNRWPVMVRDLLWSNERYGDSKPLGDAYYYFNRAQIVVSRKKVHNSLTVFSAKGGHNGEPHNHNDLGSFLFGADETMFFVDPGRGTYTKDYFGDARYTLLCNGSQGHSVPIVEHFFQQEGRTHQAVVLTASDSAEQTKFELDITKAYEDSNLLSLIRTFHFDKNNRSLSLKDHYEFEKKPSSVIERFVTFLKPAVAAPGVVRLAAQESCLEIFYDPSGMNCILSSQPFCPSQKGRETLYLIDFELKNPGKEVQFEVSAAVPV